MLPTPSLRPLIVLPSYNNRATLRGVTREALATGLPVLVADDGSTDGAGETIRDLPAARIRLPRNRGKGAAILAAARWARERGFTHLITIDADGQHDPSEAGRFVEAIGRDPLAVVVGAREAMREAGAPGASRFGRVWSNFWMRAASGAVVADSQCGFRAYPVALLAALRWRRRRYDFEIEAPARAARHGARIENVPVSVRYLSGTERVSHFRPFLDNLRISWLYTCLVARNANPWPLRRIWNRDPEAPEFDWRRPLASLLALHRRATRRLEPGQQGLSLRHPLRSLRQLHLERLSAGEIGWAAWLGIFIGALPIWGLHSIAAFYYAGRVRLNRPLAFYVSHLTNPAVPPFIPILCIELGHYLRTGGWLTFEHLDSGREALQTLGVEAPLRLWEWALGCWIVGPLYGALIGGIAWGLARLFQGRRERRRGGRRSPDYGGRLGHWCFERLIGLGGVRAAYGLLALVVPYYVLLRPSARRGAAPYLARRFPGRGGLARLWLTTRHFYRFGQCLIDQAAADLPGARPCFEFPGERGLHARAAEAGRGLVLVTSHVGPWQGAMAAIGALPVPLHLQLRVEPHTRERYYRRLFEAGRNLRLVEPDGFMGGLVELTEALNRDEAVAVMGDRPFGGPSLEVDFLGATARLPRTPWRLALATGARLEALLVSRAGPLRFAIASHDLLDPPLPAGLSRAEAEAALARRYAALLERHLESHPFLWFNFFDIWNPPAEENPPA